MNAPDTPLQNNAEDTTAANTTAADTITPPTVAAADCDEPDCRGAVAELFNYIDGELTAERRIIIRDHLDSCGPCLEAFDFHAELRTVISEKCRSELPEGLKDRVLGALRALEG